VAQFVLNTSQLDFDVLGPITFATAQASFDGLLATSVALINDETGANANLGGLQASAVVRSGSSGSLSRGPHFIQPNIQPNPLLLPKIKTVSGQGKTKLGKLFARGTSRIDFSILEEDAELLLLL
tara:strand:+ start:4123 stop:4497 length:375 start_codon:yes stop_codon:yes gene_type:complete